MKNQVFLLQAPLTTPTEPPIGLPQLAGYLRSRGLDLTVADLNIEFLNGLMTRGTLDRCLSLARRRLDRIDREPRLNGRGLLAYVPLLQHAGLASLPQSIDAAVQSFRDPAAFFDFERYLQAARVAKSALGLVSATITPFRIDFTDVSSPLHNFDSSEELYRAIDDFLALDDNVPLEILDGLLDRLFGASQPKLVGVSITYAHQFFFGMLLARMVRRRFPHAYLVLGGPFVATIANRGRKVNSFALFRDVDGIAVSDGEHALHQLLEHVLGDRPVPPIPNLITYDRSTGKGGVPDVNVVDDLDTLPCGTFDDLPLDRYWVPTPVLPLPIARGCYWDKCTFCFYGFVPDGRRATAPYRERSVENIVSDIAALNARHGCTHFDFTVDLVGPPMLDRIADALVQAKLDVKWMLEARAEKSFTPERCRRLKAGGMTYAAFGLESMDQHVLDTIGKGTKVAQYAAALQNFYDAGIATHAMGFFDFPSEDYAAGLASVQFLRENDRHLSEVGWGNFILDLGSQVEQRADSFEIDPIRWAHEDFATSLHHAQKQPRKTAEEAEALDQAFAAYQLECDKYTYVGRPFLTGGSLEPHALIYFGALGPDASSRFNRFAKHRLSPAVHAGARLRTSVEELLLHYPVEDAYVLFTELRQLLSDDKEGPVLRFTRGEGKTQCVRRFDAYDTHLDRGATRRVLASPDHVAEVSDAQWALLSMFVQPTPVDELLSVDEGTSTRIRSFLRRAVKYGWLEAV